jgi:hypothetical protein
MAAPGRVPAPWHPTYDVDKVRQLCWSSGFCRARAAREKRKVADDGDDAVVPPPDADLMPQNPHRSPPPPLGPLRPRLSLTPPPPPPTQVIRDALEEDSAGIGDLSSLST